jgi:hypothetical protein
MRPRTVSGQSSGRELIMLAGAQVAPKRGCGACIAERIEETHVWPIVSADHLQIVDRGRRIDAVMSEVASLKDYIRPDRPLPIPYCRRGLAGERSPAGATGSQPS